MKVEPSEPMIIGRNEETYDARREKHEANEREKDLHSERHKQRGT